MLLLLSRFYVNLFYVAAYITYKIMIDDDLSGSRWCRILPKLP